MKREKVEKKKTYDQKVINVLVDFDRDKREEIRQWCEAHRGVSLKTWVNAVVDLGLAISRDSEEAMALLLVLGPEHKTWQKIAGAVNQAIKDK
jgi:hypothetical protein